MKKKLIITALIGMGILTGCTKDSSLSPAADISIAANSKNVPAPPLANPGQNVPNGIIQYGIVSYQLLVLTPPGPLVQWNSGYFTSSSLIFDGYQTANDIQRFRFQTAIAQTFKLAAQIDLGTVNVSPAKYDGADLTLMLSSLNGSAAMSLTGNFSATASGANMNMPIQLNIRNTTELIGKWRNSIGVNAAQAYTARLVLDLSKLTNGITADMLLKAQKTNGIIIISDTSNTDLFSMVLFNLQNSMQLQLS
jgi:hypothetical protein